jgi:hypothetical protein
MIRYDRKHGCNDHTAAIPRDGAHGVHSDDPLRRTGTLSIELPGIANPLRHGRGGPVDHDLRTQQPSAPESPRYDGLRRQRRVRRLRSGFSPTLDPGIQYRRRTRPRTALSRIRPRSSSARLPARQQPSTAPQRRGARLPSRTSRAAPRSRTTSPSCSRCPTRVRNCDAWAYPFVRRNRCDGRRGLRAPNQTSRRRPADPRRAPALLGFDVHSHAFILAPWRASVSLAGSVRFCSAL